MTNQAEVEAMLQQFVAHFGTIDVLVNNAAVSGRSNCVDMDLEDWERIINVDLTGTFIVTKAALRYMLKANSGKIINIASQRGQLGAPQLTAYSAAKGGVISFTKALAHELGAKGMNTNIRANCVAPGPIEGGLNKNISAARRAEHVSVLPLGRFGQASEVAPSVVFLASDDSSLFTGQVLSPNCGDTMIG